jgi:hypothetical protein
MAEDDQDVNDEVEPEDEETTEDDALDSDTSGGDEDKSGADEVPTKEDGSKLTAKDWAQFRANKRKADRAAQGQRKELEKIRAENEALKKGVKPDPADEGELEKVRAEARNEGMSEAEKRWRTPYVNGEAEKALIKAGFKGDPSKYTRFVDLDSIDVDFDDKGRPTITGIDDFVEDLQIEFSELFKSEEEDPPKRQTTKKVDPGDKAQGANKQKSTADVLLDRLKAGVTS